MTAAAGAGVRAGASRHCIDIAGLLAEAPSAAPGGPSTPNCQRDWFFAELAR